VCVCLHVCVCVLVCACVCVCACMCLHVCVFLCAKCWCGVLGHEDRGCSLYMCVSLCVSLCVCYVQLAINKDILSNKASWSVPFVLRFLMMWLKLLLVVQQTHKYDTCRNNHLYAHCHVYICTRIAHSCTHTHTHTHKHIHRPRSPRARACSSSPSTSTCKKSVGIHTHSHARTHTHTHTHTHHAV